jgi:hypothetical protein
MAWYVPLEACAGRDFEIALAGFDWTLTAEIAVLVGLDRDPESFRKTF